MVYEAIISNNRVEFVQAYKPDGALVLAASLLEGTEHLLYLREKQSLKLVWCMLRFIDI